MKSIKRIIVMVLVLSILGGSFYNLGVLKSRASEIDKDISNEKEELIVNEVDLPVIGKKIYEYEENGIMYTVSSTEVNVDKYVQVIDETNNYRTDLVFRNNNKDLEVTKYENVGTDNNNILYRRISNKKINLEQKAKEIVKKLNKNDENNVVLRADFTWGKKVKDMWNGDFWYCYGKNKLGRKYLLIGCKAKYRIPYYGLSSNQIEEINDFEDYMGECNRNMIKATAIEGIEGVAAIVAAAATGGVAAIIGYIGAQAAVVPFLVDAYYAYNGIKMKYNDIKIWGTKL